MNHGRLRTKSDITFECAGCRRQTSVTAGTILHARAAAHRLVLEPYLMATHSNGISALQLQKRSVSALTAALGCSAHKLRASMVDPERNPLSGLVEITRPAFHSGPDPPTGGQATQLQRLGIDADRRPIRHRSSGDGNIRGRCGWPKSLPTKRRRPRTLRRNSPPITDRHEAKTDAGPARRSCRRSPQCPLVVGKTAARRLVLPWIHRLLQPQSMAREASTTLRRKHLQRLSVLFRLHRALKPATLLSLALPPRPPMQNRLTYSMLIEPEPCA